MAAQSGLRCVMVHFTEIRSEDLDRSCVKAILITGRSKVVGRDLDATFYPLIRNTKIPIFGFCGGMQLIGQAFSSEVGRLRKLRAGEKDPNPNYHPGQFKEWGFLPVRIVQRDPLFEGLPEEIVVRAPSERTIDVSPAGSPLRRDHHRSASPGRDRRVEPALRDGVPRACEAPTRTGRHRPPLVPRTLAAGRPLRFLGFQAL